MACQQTVSELFCFVLFFVENCSSFQSGIDDVERTGAVVKPRTLGREVPGSSPQSPFVAALSKSHIHSF